MIDEKKLINFLRNCALEEKEEWNKHDESQSFGAMCAYEHIIDYIEKEPKVGEWIPCSERLPEEYGDYLVAWRELGQNSDIPHYYEIIEYDPNDEALWIGGIPQAHGEYVVLAWQPLPEPWEETV